MQDHQADGLAEAVTHGTSRHRPRRYDEIGIVPRGDLERGIRNR